MKNNPLLDFYIENSVSPVRQDLDDYKRHQMRREKLYQKLGLPPMCFRSKNVCEVGPGGGFNSLVFMDWGSQLTLIEPNPTGVNDIRSNFNDFNIQEGSYQLYNCKLEEFTGSDQYDIIIAEGFLPGMDKELRTRIIKDIDSHLKDDGVVTVTCIDSVSIFFELIRRLIGKRLVFMYGDMGLNKTINLLTRAFDSHFKELNYSTRPCPDWITDNLINPALVNELFSIEDALLEFPQNYELLGSSPQIFIDISWYKDLSESYKEMALEQFGLKRHILLDMTLNESMREKEQNAELLKLTETFKNLLAEQEVKSQFEVSDLKVFIELLEKVTYNLKGFDEIIESINEAIEILKNERLDAELIRNAKLFRKSFGRGMQYVSFIKK